MPRYVIAGLVLLLLVVVGAIMLLVGGNAGGDSDTGDSLRLVAAAGASG